MSYYWFAAPFFAIGLGLFCSTLLHGIVHITDSLTQVVVPGTADLTLKKGPAYTVFLEQESVVNGTVYLKRRSASGLSCSVKSKSNADEVAISRTQSSLSYNVGGRSGSSVLSFQVPEDGDYQFSCRFSEGTSGPQSVVAVGTGLGTKIVKLVITCMVEMFGGTTLALCVFLSVFFQRERAQRFIRPPVHPAL
jgi:hypothetical protein